MLWAVVGLSLLATAPSTELRPKAAPFAWRLWGPVAFSAVGLVGGVTFIATAEAEHSAWITAGSEVGLLRDAEISNRFQSLQRQRNLGFALIGLGAAFIATGLVWNALTPDPRFAVSVGAGPGGAAISLGGRF